MVAALYPNACVVYCKPGYGNREVLQFCEDRHPGAYATLGPVDKTGSFKEVRAAVLDLITSDSTTIIMLGDPG